VLYTLGSTPETQGDCPHLTAAHLLQDAHDHAMGLRTLRDEDTFWCTADIGLVTGHSYIVYGPLSAGGATTVMYEGAHRFPANPTGSGGLIEKYRVNIFYTSPTAIRAFIRQGDQWPNQHDMSSLRLLGSVGRSPSTPAAWSGTTRPSATERCPIVDTWWQTGDRRHQ